jgi:hypothetical protein
MVRERSTGTARSQTSDSVEGDEDLDRSDR